jgi:hypothetical protein
MPGDRALDPGLLERLADRGLGNGLAEVDRAARERPVAVGTRLLAFGASGES